MRNVLLFGVAVLALACTATAPAASYWTADDDFNSYGAGINLSGNGGWTDTGGGTAYQTVGGGGAGGTQGITIGAGSTQINWTDHPWNWGTDLNVDDKVIARMDFQADGGAFDDDRVGWVMTSNPGSSSYHFAVQLDNPEGGLRTYFRTLTGGEGKSTLIDNATLGATDSNWYREEMQVTKLTSGLGAGGARVDVSFWALDGSGNPVGSPKTASTTIDTAAWRGFSSDVYPMYKNYSAIPGNADNAYFALVQVPEPSTLVLLLVAGGLGWAVTAYRRRK